MSEYGPQPSPEELGLPKESYSEKTIEGPTIGSERESDEAVRRYSYAEKKLEESQGKMLGGIVGMSGPLMLLGLHEVNLMAKEEIERTQHTSVNVEKIDSKGIGERPSLSESWTAWQVIPALMAVYGLSRCLTGIHGMLKYGTQESQAKREIADHESKVGDLKGMEENGLT